MIEHRTRTTSGRPRDEDMLELMELMKEAARAGRDAIRRFADGRKEIRADVKSDASLITRADRDSHKVIAKILRECSPRIPLLSEETCKGTWDISTGEWFVLDPLDGTTNFSRGIELFSVSLAYVVHGVPQAGIVLPVTGEHYYSAIRGRPSVMTSLEDGRTVPLHCKGHRLEESILSIECDFGHPASRSLWREWMEKLTPPTCRRIRVIESAALELCWLAQGKTDAYLHPSDKPWDVAAGSLIVEGAGGKLYAVNGGPWRLAEIGILAATPRIAKRLRRLTIA